VLEDIPKGERPDQPEGCPDSIYKLMILCWDGDPVRRPNFQTIVEKLKTIHESF